MKKLFLTAALIAASITTFAQVGVGTTTPKGALQVTSTTSGVIIPQFADLTAIQTIKKADGTTALDTEEQGMQVYNIADKKNYLWNGTAWVAASASGKFVDDAFGNVVLDMSTGIDSVKYTIKGYKSFPKNLTAVEDFNTSTVIPGTTPINLTDLNSYNTNVILSSNISSDGNVGTFANKKVGNYYRLKIDNNDTSTDFMTGALEDIFVATDNTQNYSGMYGKQIIALNNGSGTMGHILGSWTGGVAGINSTVGSLVGTESVAINYSPNPVTYMVGSIGAGSIRGSGTISTVTGLYARVDNKVSSSTITSVRGISSNIRFNADYTGAIVNSYDLYASPTVAGGGTITNKYGFHILGADKTNYVQGKLSVGSNVKANADISVQSVSSAPNSDPTIGLFRYYVDATNTRGSSIYHNYSGTKDMLVFGITGSSSVSKATPVSDLTQAKMVITEFGNVGIGTTTPTSKLQVVGLPTHVDNAAALTAGLTAGAFYHTGDGIVRVVF